MLSGETAVALEFAGVGASEAWRRALDDGEAGNTLFAGIGPERGFSGYYAADRIGEALVADVRAQPLALRDRFAGDGAPPSFLLQAVVEGRPGYQRGADIHLLRTGQLIARLQDPGVAIRSDRFARVTTIALPQHLLSPRYASAEALAACIGPVDDSLPGRVLFELVAGLPEDAAHQASHLLPVVGGLVAMMLGRKPRAPAPVSELAAQRSAEVMDYLRRNFSNPALDPQTLADDLSISVRYAHKLMRMTGRSFRETLTELRLEAARQAFADRDAPRQTIADIAISVGFNDLSQFNRHFRTAYGMTPRAARRQDEANGYDGPSLARSPS